MILELPIVYCKNYQEIEKAEKQGVDISHEEEILPTAFFVPQKCLIRVNQITNKRAGIKFDDGSVYTADIEYSALFDLVKMEYKKQ